MSPPQGILDLHSFKTWDEYPQTERFNRPEIRLHYGLEEIVKAPVEGPCYVCGQPTPWWSMLWDGAFFCQPLCYRAWDFWVSLDLAPWHEGAD